jgi:hypothetical protein
MPEVSSEALAELDPHGSKATDGDEIFAIGAADRRRRPADPAVGAAAEDRGDDEDEREDEGSGDQLQG